MGNLTIGLAILGGVVLAGVVAHSTWTARRNAPRQAQSLPLNHDAGKDGNPSASSHEDQRQDPQFDATLPLPLMQERRAGLDALIDAIAPISLDAAEAWVSGEAALAALPPTRRAGSKAFAVEGLNAQSKSWEVPTPGQRYSAFQAGVQLANRTGALNEIEYSEFVIKTQDFADAIGGTPEFSDMLQEVARARELDQFASAHDAQLGFSLRARSAAWSPGYVQQHAAQWGFVAGVIPGRMVLPASEAGAPPVLGLAFDTQAAMADDPAQSAIHALTLSLDVPHVARSERPFVRMREAANGLAQSMDGLLCDDQGLRIAPESLDGIGADLEQLYDTLQERDLAAGSGLARRLFS